MKRIILVLLIFSTGVVSAQKFKYGVKAGLNISSLRADYLDETNAKSKTGFHSGVFVEYAFSENFSIQPELLYSTQGGDSDSKKYDEADFYLGINPVPQLSYLNVPVMLKYEIIEKLHVELGPQIGYLLSAKSNLEYIDSSRKETLEIDILNGGNYTFLERDVQIESGVERFDYGLNFGLSYNLTKQLLLQGRYNLGLSDVDKPSVRNNTRSYNSKNSVLQFSLGFIF